ncbi:RNA-guided endonuclease InsQ/TnpB family protein [Nocardia rhizosphaerihabitans]|uniref:RNA-guided endonuclease InsQ/TnpB family protein n=1 Tax=Nocardia rhizosphaerihabitans TaxID=1691570 RepID=UPI00366D8F54
MSRHTTFRYCLDPTAEQYTALARHAGAARFAFNQCLRLHLTGRRARARKSTSPVPWTGFDLINAFNRWKKTDQAGRTIAVGRNGDAEITATGLAWRTTVCQQVFEEAAVDCGKALQAWTDSRHNKRAGRRVGHPRFKRKSRCPASFRLRNKSPQNGKPSIRIGDGDRPRSVTVPGLGRITVHDDTRRLRRLLVNGRAKVLFATISRRASRWWISLTVEATDLHPTSRHDPHTSNRIGGWVGVDRGLSVFAVVAAADGVEAARIDNQPKALIRGMKRQRRFSRAVTRKQQGSRRRKEAAARLGRHHHHIANIRRHFLHQVSNQLVKTHDRLVIEDLNVQGMLRNHHLARAISDAGWTKFAHQLAYKQRWRGGELLTADRWFPSSKTCSGCGHIRTELRLCDRVFRCDVCGQARDRDLNAATNLAIWGDNQDAQIRDPQAGGPVINAHRQPRSGRHHGDGETRLNDVGTNVQPATTG